MKSRAKHLKQDHSKKTTFTLLGGITLLGLLLRIFFIKTESRWIDETISLVIASKPLELLLSYPDPTPPLFYLLLKIPLLFVSITSLWVYVIPILASLGGIILLFYLGSELFNKQTGLLAALLLSISPINIYFAGELRAYSLFFTISLLAIYSFLQFQKQQTRKRFILLTLSNLLLLYTHPYAIFILLFEGSYFLYDIYIKSKQKKINLSFFFTQKKLFHLLGSFSISILLFLPWLVQTASNKALENISWLSTYSWRQILFLPHYLFAGHLQSMFSIFLTLIAAILACIYFFRKQKQRIFLLGWFAFVTVIPFLITISNIYSLFHLRYMLVAGAPLLLAISFILTTFQKKHLYIITSILIILSLLCTHLMFVTPTKYQWDELGEYFNNEKDTKDTVLISSFALTTVLYYTQPNCLLEPTDNELYYCGWEQATIYAPTNLDDVDYFTNIPQLTLILAGERYNNAPEILEKVKTYYDFELLKEITFFEYEGVFEQLVYENRYESANESIRIYKITHK